MTVSDWLDAREPAPPPRLRERLAALLSAHVDGAVTPEALLRASAAVLAHLVQDGDTARASALELLAADALATYAFEAQADDPEGLDEFCSWAMRTLSAVSAPA